MDDRTIKNDPSNRYGMSHLMLPKVLRPIWQGYVESNHDLRFWRPIYEPLYYTPLCVCYR